MKKNRHIKRNLTIIQFLSPKKVNEATHCAGIKNNPYIGKSRRIQHIIIEYWGIIPDKEGMQKGIKPKLNYVIGIQYKQ